jgi:uncharacterized protein (DUF488 family)
MQTTYFAKAKSLPISDDLVSIARGTPEGFKGRVMSKLMPTASLLSRLKNNLCTEEGFTKEFIQQLRCLDVHAIAKELGPNATMICFEGKDKFCHRHLVAEWLQKNGYTVTEL